MIASFVYQYCEGVSQLAEGGIKFETRSWCPEDMELQELAREMVARHVANPTEAPWLRFFEEATEVLEAEGAAATAWRRPSADTDRLYMGVGGGDVIEVAHPLPRDGREDPRYVCKTIIKFIIR